MANKSLHSAVGGSRAGRKIADRRQPPGWFYLSFATPTEFLGAAIVQGHGLYTARLRATELGIHPGGETMCVKLSADDVQRTPADTRDRLLREADIRRLKGLKK
jgi:hypothetical protein